MASSTSVFSQSKIVGPEVEILGGKKTPKYRERLEKSFSGLYGHVLLFLLLSLGGPRLPPRSGLQPPGTARAGWGTKDIKKKGLWLAKFATLWAVF